MFLEMGAYAPLPGLSVRQHAALLEKKTSGDITVQFPWAWGRVSFSAVYNISVQADPLIPGAAQSYHFPVPQPLRGRNLLVLGRLWARDPHSTWPGLDITQQSTTADVVTATWGVPPSLTMHNVTVFRASFGLYPDMVGATIGPTLPIAIGYSPDMRIVTWSPGWLVAGCVIGGLVLIGGLAVSVALWLRGRRSAPALTTTYVGPEPGARMSYGALDGAATKA